MIGAQMKITSEPQHNKQITYKLDTRTPFGVSKLGEPVVTQEGPRDSCFSCFCEALFPLRIMDHSLDDSRI